MKTTVYLPSGSLTDSQKSSLIEHTSLEESHFESSRFREWRCHEEELSQEEMDLEKVAKLTQQFTVEIDGEHIYLTGREYE